MAGEAQQILLLHQDTPVLEHARGHVARSRSPAYSVSFVLSRFLMPLENNLKTIYATPILVTKVLRYVGYNLFSMCCVIALSTETSLISVVQDDLYWRSVLTVLMACLV